MGDRGPPPTPEGQHASWRSNPKYKGSSGHKTPKPKKGEPPMPYGLSDGAQQVWHEVVPSLLRMQVLAVEDGLFVELFCETVAAWKDCRDFLLVPQWDAEKEKWVKPGFSEMTAKQGSRQRPEATMLSKLGGDIVRMADRLGLNASARTRIQVTPTEEPADDEAGKKMAATKKKYGGLSPE